MPKSPKESNIITPSSKWVWLQRDTTIYKQLSKEHKSLDRTIQNILSFLSHQGKIREHIYDSTNNTQNMLLDREVYSQVPSLVFTLQNLGWKEKEPPVEDLQERKDFYDALLKGGTLQ